MVPAVDGDDADPKNKELTAEGLSVANDADIKDGGFQELKTI